MKKRRSLFRATLIGLTLTLAVGPLTAQAMEAQPVPDSETIMSIDPRFEYISRIACGLTISADGYASTTGSYTMYDGMDGTITLSLYRYVNNRWVFYQEDSKDFTGNGNKMFTTGWDVSSGYRYRSTATVEIKDASGTVVETISCDSPTKEY